MKMYLRIAYGSLPYELTCGVYHAVLSAGGGNGLGPQVGEWARQNQELNP